MYLHYCSFCHGEKGAGDGMNAFNLKPRPANFTDPATLAGKADEYLLKNIRDHEEATGVKTAMPPWNLTLSDDQIKDILKYIKTLAKETQSR